MKKRASKVAHNRPRPFYFTVQPRPMAHSPELIFHIMKSRDQTSVLLSVVWHNFSNTHDDFVYTTLVKVLELDFITFSNVHYCYRPGESKEVKNILSCFWHDKPHNFKDSCIFAAKKCILRDTGIGKSLSLPIHCENTLSRKCSDHIRVQPILPHKVSL